MKLIFLGTGTSQGIPVIGCDCAVCASNDTRDTRLRSSVMFIDQNFHLLIDMGPDLRQQMLSNNLNDIDAICLTHEHNDHVSGLDEIRPINFKWNKSIPIYTLARVIDELKRRFHYAFEDNYSARPRLNAHAVKPGEKLRLGPFDIETITVNHGNLDILGFIVNEVAYLTDVKILDEVAMQRIDRCHTVIVSALHKKKHPSHQSLTEALATIEKLPATRFYITHIAHQMGFHEQESHMLPENIHFAYDGMVVNDL